MEFGRTGISAHRRGGTPFPTAIRYPEAHAALVPVKRQPEHDDVASALSAALEPVIDVCLKLGITIPELEQLLRSAFVQRAFAQIPPHPRIGRASDNRVSLATGLHREEVSKLRAAASSSKPRPKGSTKERVYSKSARVLQGWSTDPKFLSSAGLPIVLPLERSPQHRSFDELVEQYAPGSFPRTLLKELQRHGNAELLEGNMVRYRSANTRPRGATQANLARAAKRVKRFGDTLFRNLLEPDRPHLDAEMKPFMLTAQQFAALLPELERSATQYLAGLERQFMARSASGVDDKPKRVGVNLFSWEED